MDTPKQKLYNQCVALIKEKRDKIEGNIALLQASLTSESKSTAGDKHETGRAMIQLEREKLGNQLKQLELEETVLAKVRIDNKSNLIALGSYVETNNMDYYLSISLGKIKLDDKNVFAISSKSPIGALLLGKEIGDEISFNGKSSIIKAIN